MKKVIDTLSAILPSKSSTVKAIQNNPIFKFWPVNIPLWISIAFHQIKILGFKVEQSLTVAAQRVFLKETIKNFYQVRKKLNDGFQLFKLYFATLNFFQEHLGEQNLTRRNMLRLAICEPFLKRQCFSIHFLKILSYLSYMKIIFY